MWDHFLSHHWAQLSPDLPLNEFVRYAHAQVAQILPDSPPRFVNLNEYMWSERWLERYQQLWSQYRDRVIGTQELVAIVLAEKRPLGAGPDASAWSGRAGC